jgi:Tol biopolymer transport system component
VFQFINARGIDELWISSADHDDLQRVPIESKADAFFGTWSPDGRRLAYRRSGKDGKDGVYVIDVESGEMRCILPFKTDGDYYDANCWVSDGSGLILTRNVHGVSSVAFLPATGDQWGEPQPVALGEGRHFLPTVSPDGRALAFQSDDAGKVQSYVVGFHAGQVTGRAVPVPTSSSFWHQWSNDGTALFVQDDHNRLQKVAVSTAPAVTVGAPKEFADLEKSKTFFWAVLPGDRLLVGQKNANELNVTRLNVVLNWTTLLQQKVAK